MKKRMILISGMPAAGKTTFALWLSRQLHLPLICYDNIKKSISEISNRYGMDAEKELLLKIFPYEMFLFYCEEMMKSSAEAVAEFLFSEQMEEKLGLWAETYGYEIINIHLDLEPKEAYRRFAERNRQQEKDEIRPHEISFQEFQEAVKQNRDFRYGHRLIEVDTTDFEKVSYEDILAQLRNER